MDVSMHRTKRMWNGLDCNGIELTPEPCHAMACQAKSKQNPTNSKQCTTNNCQLLEEIQKWYGRFWFISSELTCCCFGVVCRRSVWFSSMRSARFKLYNLFSILWITIKSIIIVTWRLKGSHHLNSCQCSIRRGVFFFHCIPCVLTELEPEWLVLFECKSNRSTAGSLIRFDSIKISIVQL